MEMERGKQGFGATRIDRIPLGILKVSERPDPLLDDPDPRVLPRDFSDSRRVGFL